MNVNDYVIADTVFGSPVLWASEKVFMKANRMGVLKIAYRPKYRFATCGSHVALASHLFCFLHCVLLDGFPSKRATARSLLSTSRSTMFSCSRGV